MKNVKITVKENKNVRDHSLHHLARKKEISQKNFLTEDEKSLKTFFFNDFPFVSCAIPYCILAVVTWSREINIF